MFQRFTERIDALDQGHADLQYNSQAALVLLLREHTKVNSIVRCSGIELRNVFGSSKVIEVLTFFQAVRMRHLNATYDVAAKVRIAAIHCKSNI